MRVLIIGCGYVGFPLGVQLRKDGHEVFGLKRTAEGTETWLAQGIEPLIADITNPETLASLPTNFDWVVHAVSSSKGGIETYKSVYLDGTRNVVEWLKGSGLKKFVYTSSTSVYGQTDGSLVKENSPTEPATETSQTLVATEQLLLKAHQEFKFPALILRVAGIYGPDRGHLFHQYLKNEARMHGKGDRIINMIYLDDLVGAIISALKGGRAGEIYNVVDDEPVTQLHFFRWLSESVGKYMPPAASEEEIAGRKRGLTNKKVSNRRLKMELGYTFKFPTFRQGYTTEMIRLERAGKLNITPDPR
ncbi:MAG: NAD-dependent epimerase/dehydratase [Verrucomicrobiales bacterium]|nr:NAD-dependent epimerase/dehydratase [Verrucomicrobiales bacterium]